MVGEEMSTQSGFFLPVENVQALASNNSGEIPSRYLRPELQSEEVLADESIQIPTIDMRKLMVAEDEMGKLHYACKEWGFFQVQSLSLSLGILIEFLFWAASLVLSLEFVFWLQKIHMKLIYDILF